MWFAAILLFILLSSTINLDKNYSLEVLIGFILSLPFISFLSTLSPRHSFDFALGQLAYPIFLLHSPIYFLLGHHTGLQPPLVNHLTLVLTLVLSYFSVILLEQPFRRFRQHWLHHLPSRYFSPAPTSPLPEPAPQKVRS